MVRKVNDQTIYLYGGKYWYITAIRTGSSLVYIEPRDIVESNKTVIMSEVYGEWVDRNSLEIVD